MYQIIFFVPESHCESVKQALFEAGAGQLGDYQHCSWQVLGQGQFRPMAGANPAIGRVGRLEKLGEWRVEMLCCEPALKAAVEALKTAHPYEMPAYHIVPVLDL